MVKSIHLFLLTALLALGLAQNSRAALFDVSPELFGTSGYPVWYQDFSNPAANPDANPNYGIGPTVGGLKLEFCPATSAMCLSAPVDPADPNSVALGVGEESFWWTADASVLVPAGGALARDGAADLILAMEGAFGGGTPLADDQVTFGRIRIRVDTPVAGTYKVTHPFGVLEIEAAAGINGINETEDLGLAVGNFRGALASNIGPWLFWDTELPQVEPPPPAVPTAFFIGNPGLEHTVLGSPLGTNFFRVDGPPGSNLGGPGKDFVETNLFAVSGKVFTNGGLANTAPVAVPDTASTLADTPVVIDVLANDTFTDIPINPGSLPALGTTIASTNGGTARRVVTPEGLVKLEYTPRAGFFGEDTFTYTIQNFAGNPAAGAAGTVTVTVEDLKVNKAEFRPKFLKWRISGTSTDAAANTIGIQSGPATVSTILSGAQEIPPNPRGPSGSVNVTVGESSIDFTLSITNPDILNITVTHLHMGAPGTNGPVLFALAGANVTNTSGTLTAADLSPTAGVTFDEAVEAILGGNAYIQVHTATRPAGEVRGQFGPNRLIGSATVQGTGAWSFDGKSVAFPDDTRTISVRSSNRVRVINVPLTVK